MMTSRPELAWQRGGMRAEPEAKRLIVEAYLERIQSRIEEAAELFEELLRIAGLDPEEIRHCREEAIRRLRNGS